jgi:endonuclease YncB( thermonuclease family)
LSFLRRLSFWQVLPGGGGGAEPPRYLKSTRTQGKTIIFDYDAYTSDRFGRVLAYVIVDGKNVSVELARQGLVKVTIYEDRRKLKYQDELLKAQDEAKQKKFGVWK